jgi:hypothetical protein
MLIRRSPQAGHPGATQQIIDTPILAAALRYAEAGIPIFPCRPGGKTPLTPHGHKDATTDTATILRWWHRWPHANLAMPTGAPGWNIFDVDVRPGGDGRIALHQVSEAGLLAGCEGRVGTPSGGEHLYFPGTEEPSSKITNHYIDWKACGGYVLLPPSKVDGVSYTWLQEISPLGTPLPWAEVKALFSPPLAPRAPSTGVFSLGDRRTGRATSSLGVAPLVRHVLRLQQGERNIGFFWAVCRAMEKGHGDLSVLRDAGLCIGLTPAEVDASISSARQTVEPR